MIGFPNPSGDDGGSNQRKEPQALLRGTAEPPAPPRPRLGGTSAPAGTTAGGDVAQVDAVFAALSDATRRRVVAELSAGRAGTATAIAALLPVSRQAVAKHLAVLADAGLVAAERVGRETRYRLTPEPLGAAMAWMVDVGAEWDVRLSRLRDLVEGDG